jgi:hypothetical protein
MTGDKDVAGTVAWHHGDWEREASQYEDEDKEAKHRR